MEQEDFSPDVDSDALQYLKEDLENDFVRISLLVANAIILF
jgi:hypothetical protein